MNIFSLCHKDSDLIINSPYCLLYSSVYVSWGEFAIGRTKYCPINICLNSHHLSSQHRTDIDCKERFCLGHSLGVKDVALLSNFMDDFTELIEKVKCKWMRVKM